MPRPVTKLRTRLTVIYANYHDDDLFSQYDSDSDGKLSGTEAKDALAALFEALKPDSAMMKKLFYESSSYKPVDVTA